MTRSQVSTCTSLDLRVSQRAWSREAAISTAMLELSRMGLSLEQHWQCPFQKEDTCLRTICINVYIYIYSLWFYGLACHLERVGMRRASQAETASRKFAKSARGMARLRLVQFDQSLVPIQSQKCSSKKLKKAIQASHKLCGESTQRPFFFISER